MNQRLKELRKALGMNQKTFAESLGMGQSTLAMMEVGKRKITERHIKTICSMYDVNEKWFVNGENSMFIDETERILKRLSAKYELTEDERDMIKSFLKLTHEQRKIISEYVRFIANQKETKDATKQPKVEASKELVPEYKSPLHMADEDIDNTVEQIRQVMLLEREAEEKLWGSCGIKDT